MTIKSISALLMVSLFLVLAAPVMAEDNQTPTPTPTPTSTPAPSTNPNLVPGLACMKTAVVTRDNYIISAWGTASASITAAYAARRDALSAAWGITVRKDRNAALVKAWKDFRSSTKSAKNTFNTARNTAWKQFNTDGKACKKQYGASNTTAQDYGTKGSDMSL